jgi:hypothetical protein
VRCHVRISVESFGITGEIMIEMGNISSFTFLCTLHVFYKKLFCGCSSRETSELGDFRTLRKWAK